MDNKELKKIAKKNIKIRIYTLSDVFQREEVKQAMMDMFISGYKHKEFEIKK